MKPRNSIATYLRDFPAKRYIAASQSGEQLTLSLMNSGIRGLGLIARFALTVYLAKFINLTVVGVFGLIYGVISMMPAILGLGLNFSFNREIIGLPIADAGAKVRDRLAVTTTMLLVAACLFWVLTAVGLVPAVLHGSTVVLIASLEVLAFDIHMALLSLRMPLFANWLLFLRTGSWIYPFIATGWMFPAFRTLDALLYAWLGALVLNFIWLFVRLRDWPWMQILGRQVDRMWIKMRIRSSGMIYASDLGIIGSSLLDRFIVGYWLGIEMTGVFTFFWSLANAVQLLVNVGVVQISLPRLVDTYTAGGAKSLWIAVKADLFKVLILGAVLAVSTYAGIMLAIPHLGRPQLSAYPYLFPLMLIASVIRLGSDVTSYGLYASRRDRHWALTNLLGVVLSGVFTTVGILVLGLSGVGIAMIGTAVVLFVTRTSLLDKGRDDVTGSMVTADAAL